MFKMDPRLTSTLLGLLLFLVFASEYAYALVKKMLSLKGDMSLLARGAVFGLVFYFVSAML
jgi:hypothetical protein